MFPLSFPRKRESSFFYPVLCATLSAIYNLDWYNQKVIMHFYRQNKGNRLTITHLFRKSFYNLLCPPNRKSKLVRRLTAILARHYVCRVNVAGPYGGIVNRLCHCEAARFLPPWQSLTLHQIQATLSDIQEQLKKMSQAK